MTEKAAPTIPSKYPCYFGMCRGDFPVTPTLRAVIGFFLFSFIVGVTEKVAPTIVKKSSRKFPVVASCLLVGVRLGASPRLAQKKQIPVTEQVTGICGIMPHDFDYTWAGAGGVFLALRPLRCASITE